MKQILTALVIATAWWTPAVLAQPKPAEKEPTVITLRPAAEPRPALKYRLVPERRDLVNGNAALFYHRAIQLEISKRAQFAAQEKAKVGERSESIEERISNWAGGPLAKIPRDEARKQLETFETVLKEVELGAMRSTCDWGFDQREEGITLLLPDIQEMRMLARLVAVRADVAILDGKTDEAFHWIQIGLVMGRHVSQGPTVIQALVGIAIDTVMAKCLEELIQAPGTPSLYWALADRPRPFIDLRQAMEGERYLLEKELPELKDVDRGAWSLDEARRFTDELQRKLLTISGGRPFSKGPDGMSSFGRQFGIAATASKIYPPAKQALLDQGRPAAEVDAMPVVQVVLIHTLQEYQRNRDNNYKWMNLPYWQSHARIDRSRGMSAQQKLANPLLTLFEMLDPALNQARLAPLRLDRQLDALQCIEAIRLHADAHGGKLPASLDAITDAPVPIDPITGKSFAYTRDGDTAVLSAPMPPGLAIPQYAIEYVLNLAH